MPTQLTSAERAGRRRVAVIGAGIVGICCARELIDRGFDVEVFDASDPGSGCSFGNAGVLSAWSCVPLSMPGEWKLAPKWLMDPWGPLSIDFRYLPRVTPWLLGFLRAGRRERIRAISDAMFALNNPCVDLYRRLLKGTGHESLVRDSVYVHLYRDPRDANANAPGYRLRRAQGASVRRLDAGDLRELEPSVSADYRAALIIENQGRTVNPARLCRVLAESVSSRGGRLTRAEVRALTPSPDGGVRIDADGASYSADHAVVAAGAWSRRLVAPLGARLPLESGRGYHLMFPPDGVTLNNSVVDNDLHVAASAMETGIRVSGMMEFAGLEARAAARRYRRLAALAKRMIPKLNGAPSERWMGHRPVFPDTLPVIGPLPGHPRVLLAFGHGQLGLTGAPMTARIVASLAAGEAPNLDLSPYAAERFARWPRTKLRPAGRV